MRKNITILLVVLLAMGWVQGVSSLLAIPKEYETHLSAAEKYAKKEIYEDALEEYQSALLLKPENEEIKLSIAEMQLKLGDKTAFITGCEELIYADILNVQALNRLIEYYSENGKKDAIVDMLKRLKETEPENERVMELWKQYAGSYEIMGYSYENVKPFYFGYAVVESAGQPFIVGTNGKSVLDDIYEEVGYFSEDEQWAAVKKDGTWYYITTEEYKKIVPDEPFEQVGIISEGVIVVCKDGKYSFADTGLVPQSEESWDAASNMYEGIAAVKKDGKWALIDKRYKLITEYIYEDVKMDELGFVSFQERIFVKKDDGYHMVNCKNEEIGNLVYEDAKAFGKEGLTAVCIGGKWGFVNTEGELVIDCQYEDAKVFANGAAPVKQNGKWGYIDEKNNMIINPVFVDAHVFNEDGTAFVKEELWTLIKLYAISE